MENIDQILLPDMAKKPEKVPKPRKTSQTPLTEVKERLPKTNRNVECAYCNTVKILNPVQYQLLFDIHGSDDKITQEYMCKSCEMTMRGNPIKFWITHGELLHDLCRKLKGSFDTFKQNRNSVELQQTAVAMMHSANVYEPNFQFIIEDGNPVGMAILRFPFVGQITLKVYEQRKNRIIIREV